MSGRIRAGSRTLRCNGARSAHELASPEEKREDTQVLGVVIGDFEAELLQTAVLDLFEHLPVGSNGDAALPRAGVAIVPVAFPSSAAPSRTTPPATTLTPPTVPSPIAPRSACSTSRASGASPSRPTAAQTAETASAAAADARSSPDQVEAGLVLLVHVGELAGLSGTVGVPLRATTEASALAGAAEAEADRRGRVRVPVDDATELVRFREGRVGDAAGWM